MGNGALNGGNGRSLSPPISIRSLIRRGEPTAVSINPDRSGSWLALLVLMLCAIAPFRQGR